MIAREDQLLAQIDQRQLAAVGEHGFDGVGIERLWICLKWHERLTASCPALCRASTSYFRAKAWMAGTSPAMTLNMWQRECLRRLLRCHLMDFAGLQVDADAVDVVEIDAGHAHEARLVRIVDRMNLAVLVDAGVAG